MAVIKHIAIKNSNYNAASDYLTTKHDEFTSKPILDESGRRIPRDEYIIEGINCDPYSFGEERISGRKKSRLTTIFLALIRKTVTKMD